MVEVECLTCYRKYFPCASERMESIKKLFASLKNVFKPKKVLKPEPEDPNNNEETPEASGDLEGKHKLESVLTYLEEVPLGVERFLANNLDHAFQPCRIFSIALFRFPLLLIVKPDFSRTFTYSWKSFRGWMFFITGALMFINAILITVSIFGVLLNFPSQFPQLETRWTEKDIQTKSTVIKSNKELRIEELFLIQRNFVPIIMVVLSLCHVCTGDVSLFFKRKFVSKYFSFWDEAVEVMKIDAAVYPENVRRFMLRTTTFYCGFLLTFLGLCALKFAPIASGAPAQLVILWSRTFFPPIHAIEYFEVLVYFGDIVLAYIVMCSKVYVLLFLYYCKIMKNAFAIWNERLEKVLHKREQGGSRKEQCENRTGYDHLFRDYVVLLDLLRGSDTLFANIIESYYGTQTFSICFEFFYLIRSVTAPQEFQKGYHHICMDCMPYIFIQARKLDAILIAVYLFHSLIMLFLASTAAAEVGDVAMNGLEIIRRKGCLGRKSDEEMYFTLSLYMSYTGHFETALTAGRYVIFDRGFLVAFMGSIFTYFIILIQFTPPLAMLDPIKLQIIKPMELIWHVENTDTGKFNLGQFETGYSKFISFANGSM